MVQKVHDIPSYEEFYGLINNEISDEEFESENKDEKIKQMIGIMLGLLQEFYIEHKFDTESYILSERFSNELDSFNIKLKDVVIYLFSEYIKDIQAELNVEYVIPTGTIESKVNIETILNSAIDTVTDTLYTDLKNKSVFYKDMAIITGVFSLHANFRRAIKRLTNQIDFNAQYTRNLINRDYLSFIYGQEALFYWRVTGIHTCEWCYKIAAMGAIPLSQLPIDHPNGGCWVEPANPDEYSDNYKIIRGW